MTFSLIPLDHYTALHIAQDATSEEVETAYAFAVIQVSATRISRLVGLLFGRSLLRLDAARAELLDSAKRKEYDKYLKNLRIWLSNPPQ
jgi:hypothetical protein